MRQTHVGFLVGTLVFMNNLAYVIRQGRKPTDQNQEVSNDVLYRKCTAHRVSDAVFPRLEPWVWPFSESSVHSGRQRLAFARSGSFEGEIRCRAVRDGPDAEQHRAPRLSRHLLYLISLSLAFSGAGALACPVADDLTAGVRVDYADDSYSVITREADGSIRETEHADGEVYIYVTANGLLETGYEEPATGTHDTFKYTFDTSELVPPAPWRGQRGEQITVDQDGAETNRVGFSYHTRGASTYAIGDCSFPAIGLQTYYENPDEKSLVEFVYLLDLGVSIITGYGGPGYYDPQRPTRISVESE